MSDDGEVEADSINRDETVFRWENKIAEETTVPPSERKASLDSDSYPSKINLYSENVIAEDETTDVVDREPIANIASTKKHWENIFSEKINKKDEEVKPKGTVRHWEVKIHKYEKSSANVENNIMADSDVNENESAIEREIRLALEREEMLRKEKAALAETMGYHNGHSNNNNNEDKSTVIIAETERPVHASYDEMTEVDRAAEMLRRRVMGDLEPLNPPPEDEPVFNRRSSDASSQGSDGRAGVFLNESIVEREIREATEREEERRRERANHRTTSRGSLSDNVQPAPTIITSADDSTDGMDRIRGRISPEISYEAAVAQPDHSGESLIARELRETREREEELRRLRQHVYAAPSNTVTASAPPAQNGSSKPAPEKNGHVENVEPNRTNKQNTWQKEVSPYVNNNGHKRNSSVDSLSSSHSSSRGGTESKPVKVQPLSSAHPEESPKSYEPCSETPIEREIRLAREREDDFRRAKGLPIDDRKSNPHAVETTTTSPGARSVGHSSDSSSTLKRLTNHRLKQEIKKEMQREEVLRKEGKISTTSDERTGQPMKFVEVIDQTDSAPKRNFVVKKRETSSPKVDKPAANGSVTPTSPAVPASSGSTQPSSVTPKRSGIGGSATFSYKETKQKAESRIERELREMREREAELKTQRANATISSPGPVESPS